MAPRERGWWSLLSALATFLLVPATPLVRTVVPIEQTWVLLLPALAVCTLVGWRAGGRLTVALLWTGLAVWALTHSWAPDGEPGGYDRLARGWALLLTGAFGTVFVLGSRRRFFSIALSAVALSTAAGLALALPSGDADRLHDTVVRELTARDAQKLAQLDEFRESEEGRKYLADDPNAAETMDQASKLYHALPARVARLAPALLALESLAALALAWALYHRISRVRIGPPLGSLKQFRFNDQLIWGVIVGIIILVLPALDQLRVVGMNLALFFGTLYVLRGVGVFAYFFSVGRLAAVVFTLVAVFFWPVSAVGAFGLGLGDTWLDWRRPRTPTA
jgi:hypothetical protein